MAPTINLELRASYGLIIDGSLFASISIVGPSPTATIAPKAFSQIGCSLPTRSTLALLSSESAKLDTSFVGPARRDSNEQLECRKEVHEVQRWRLNNDSAKFWGNLFAKTAFVWGQ